AGHRDPDAVARQQLIDAGEFISSDRGCSTQCLLLGVKRTWRLHCEMSAHNPKRTFVIIRWCSAKKRPRHACVISSLSIIIPQSPIDGPTLRPAQWLEHGVYRVAYRYLWSKNQSKRPQYCEVRLNTIFIPRTATRASKATQSPRSAIARSTPSRTGGRIPFSSRDLSRSEGASTNASVGRYLRPQG